MHRALRNAHAGIARACADDIGASLRGLYHLKILQPIFQCAKEIAGLNLKPSKCVLVPLCEFSPQVVNKIHRWLLKHIPAWSEFNIRPATELLGFLIGPQMGSLNWRGPMKKFKDRLSCIRGRDASVSLKVFTHNSEVIPVSQYQTQFSPLLHEFVQLERVAMHTILRLPQNA